MQSVLSGGIRNQIAKKCMCNKQRKNMKWVPINDRCSETMTFTGRKTVVTINNYLS